MNLNYLNAEMIRVLKLKEKNKLTYNII